jgi:hypothetical protein
MEVLPDSLIYCAIMPHLSNAGESRIEDPESRIIFVGTLRITCSSVEVFPTIYIDRQGFTNEGLMRNGPVTRRSLIPGPRYSRSFSGYN